MSSPIWRRLTTIACLTLLAWSLPARAGEAYPFVFRDTAREVGLYPAIEGIVGHAAAWSDVDNDGWPDLYIGTFRANGPKANLCFRNEQGRFRLVETGMPVVAGCATGVTFPDLDNDGDTDAFVVNLNHARTEFRNGINALLRNDGAGQFSDLSPGNLACPPRFAARAVVASDMDGDGLLDLLVGEEPWKDQRSRTRLFRNLGKLAFEPREGKDGLPGYLPAVGLASADVNDDGWPDFFVASRAGGDRFFLNDRQGGFAPAKLPETLFTWTVVERLDTAAGVAFADLNRDGLLDLVVGQHFRFPWRAPVPIRLFLHRGVTNGQPRYEEITNAAGLLPLPLKAPHVELQDFDNDGWPDILTSMVKFANGRAYPVIYRHLGLNAAGLPHFTTHGLEVNDFPTAADQALSEPDTFYDKMIADGKVVYFAAGPTGDYDRDGRLDLILPNWWANGASLLLRNETPGGHWLRVRVTGSGGVNRQGVGTKVLIYRAGALGEPAALLGCQEISLNIGYCSGQEPVAHFGLGPLESVDVLALLPHGQGRLSATAVKAGQILTLTRE